MADPRPLTERSPTAPAEGSPDRRVELVHESLLTKWPRLVRWRTQDSEGAQLRDELRQAAQLWDQHGRGEDFLWTGTAFREYALWRERYPGGLTELEEAFAEAMTALASRHRRRRRLALATAFVVLLVVLGVVGGLWQRGQQETRRAEAEADRAEAETERAEATKLVALGQLELEKNASSAIAHAIASLELDDGIDARRLALAALWKGPTALVVHEIAAFQPSFSPDGSFLVHSSYNTLDEVRIVYSDGRIELIESQDAAMRSYTEVGPESDVVLISHAPSESKASGISFWSVADRGVVASAMYHEGPRPFWGGAWGDGRFLLGTIDGDRSYLEAIRFDGSRERLGSLDFDPRSSPTTLDPQRIARVVDNEVRAREIGERGLSKERVLGRHEGTEVRLVRDPLGRHVTTFNDHGRIRLWAPDGAAPPIPVEGPPSIARLEFSEDGSLLSAYSEDERCDLWVWSMKDGSPRLLRRFDLLCKPGDPSSRRIDGVGGHLARVDWTRNIALWDFRAPAGAEPLLLGRNEPGIQWTPAFDPSGRWLATGSNSGLTFYPLTGHYAFVLRHNSEWIYQIAFSADGRLLATLDGLQALRLWPLDGPVPEPGRSWSLGGLVSLALSPDGKQAFLGTAEANLLVPLDGGPPRKLVGFAGQTSAVAFSPDGRLAVGVGGMWRRDENEIRVWVIATGEVLRVLRPEADVTSLPIPLQFLDNLHLLSTAKDGLRLWNVETGESELIFSGHTHTFSASPPGNRILLVEERNASTPQDANTTCGPALLLDLEKRISTPLTNHGSDVCSVALDESGTIAATGDSNGLIRVGPVTGEEPYWLVGHERSVWSLAVDPQGRWIASSSDDATVRLWPMPDLSKPPLHALPRAELIAKLKTLTNYRVRSDPESSTGWKLALDPFPGWETVPTW